MNALARLARVDGAVPLAWAGGTQAQDYLNLGDALSPVMVALLSGLPVRRVPFVSTRPRLVAVGTIGQNVEGGEAWFWGTGCSPRSGGTGKGGRYGPPRDLRAHVAATRGPLAATLLGGGRLATRTFGDPVQLLPRFYRPEIEKRWDLGVIVHLSELADRDVAVCRPKPELVRYRVPKGAEDRVRLINTVTPISADGLKARLDEILACRRIVSTSLHGLVFAEAWGIPCLPLVVGKGGLGEVELTPEAGLDARTIDLYMGYDRTRTPVWRQPREAPMDWEALIRAIDRVWEPARIDEEALMAAFPLDLEPLAPPPGRTIWEHPTIAGIGFAEDVKALRLADRQAGEAEAREGAVAQAGWSERLRAWRLPAVAVPSDPPPRLRLARGEAGAELPLSWVAGRVAGSANDPQLNLGDALSPVIVAALSGLPVRHAAFDAEAERLAAVGTIAHGQRRGAVHLWGSGLDEAVNPLAPGEPWSAPPRTLLHVHATRGPATAAALRRQGIDAPEIFGDPVYLLDRIFPLGEVEPCWDLGVIVHLSEIEAEPGGKTGAMRVKPEHRRYHVPEAFDDRVRIIDMNVRPSLSAFRERLADIASCRTILSTSLHGLVIADVYRRPNAWFGFRDLGRRDVDPLNRHDPLDHRMRDLYAGQGLARVPVLDARRDRPADWDRLIGLMGEIEPRRVDTRPLFDAFPGPRAAAWEEPVWPLPPGLVPGLAA